MFLSSSLRRHAGAAVIGALLCAAALAVRAEETYTAPDGKLTFSFPRSWRVENVGERVRLTAPDASHYLITRDSVTALPGDSPAANPELRAKAADLVKPLLPQADFADAAPLTMDHGVGAAYRFHWSRGATGVAAAVYMAFIGPHSLTLLPERAGQSNQSIALAGILQSLAFTDALPKPAPAQRGQPQRMMPGAGAAMITGPATIRFDTQIAPILKEKCEVCHRSGAALGGFSVTTFADVIKGGRNGAAVQAGNPGASPLLDYLTGRRQLMPKGGPPLPADEIALIRKWVAEGAREQPGAPSAQTTGAGAGGVSPNNPAGLNPNRLRPALTGVGAGRLARPGAVAAGPQLLEGYSGHLVASDEGFTLRLHMDRSATAVWSLTPGREVRYSGAYAGQDGNYLVTLTQSGGAAIDQVKTLTIELRAKGSQETGIYGFNGGRPRQEIAELELSEIRTSDKPSRPGTGRPATRPSQMRRRL